MRNRRQKNKNSAPGPGFKDGGSTKILKNWRKDQERIIR
jgi:hypothetical protein